MATSRRARVGADPVSRTFPDTLHRLYGFNAITGIRLIVRTGDGPDLTGTLCLITLIVLAIHLRSPAPRMRICSYSAWVGWGVRSAGGDRLICDESRGVLFSLV